MMGSSLVYEQTHSRGKPAGDRHANMSKKKKKRKNQSTHSIKHRMKNLRAVSEHVQLLLRNRFF